MISKFISLPVSPTYYAFTVLLIMLICISYSVADGPVSYKEDVTTSPRRHKERLGYRKDYNNLSVNRSPLARDRFRTKGCSSYKYNKDSEFARSAGESKLSRVKLVSLEDPRNLGRVRSNVPGQLKFSSRSKSIALTDPNNSDHTLSSGLEEPFNSDRAKSVRAEEQNSLDRVKAVNLGEKTMRQSDDDDDDDDGGEEEGMCDNAKLSASDSTEDTKQDKVPFLIVQGKLDMLAMEIPIKAVPDRSDAEKMRTDKNGKACGEPQQKARIREKGQNDMKSVAGFLPRYKFKR